MKNKNSLVSEQINTSGDDTTTWALPEGAIARFGQGLGQDMAFSALGSETLPVVSQEGNII